jgi:glutamate-1-semialdehyde 2,1-aminomutase
VLADLCGKPVIRHVVDHCREFGEKTILAVPYSDIGVFSEFGVPIHYGPEDDVLERYMSAACAYGFETVMRITGDCPLITPELMERVYKLALSGCSYAAIGWPEGGFPKGYGCEIFPRRVLEHAHDFARAPLDREHVTPWMRRNVRCKYLQNDKDESHINYCVDYPQDIARLEKIIGENQNRA